ncbi:MAG: hypothetical protein KJ905_02960 [Nanoarchaeota archaeon]|nr:hypothetical protein [Nanoarchaeota archaeon]MBU1501709.1 hypothetical protein [Nanoarchaeota archaeon]
MEDRIFEVVDKSGRKIRFAQKQWKHMTKRHPYMAEYLEKTLKIPNQMRDCPNSKEYYYKSYKHLKSP